MISEPFRYSPDEWAAIREQLRNAREGETCEALEEEARLFLGSQTPAEMREDFAAELRDWIKLRAYAWRLVALRSEPARFSPARRATTERKLFAQLDLCGYGPDLEFEDGVTLETSRGAEHLAWFADSMIEHGRDVVMPPEGNEDPSRRKYLFALCDLWGRRLARPVGASWNPIEGDATGPMVRFLTAAANPALVRAGRKTLSAVAAKNTISDFQIERSKKARAAVLGQRQIM